MRTGKLFVYYYFGLYFLLGGVAWWLKCGIHIMVNLLCLRFSSRSTQSTSATYHQEQTIWWYNFDNWIKLVTKYQLHKTHMNRHNLLYFEALYYACVSASCCLTVQESYHSWTNRIRQIVPYIFGHCLFSTAFLFLCFIFHCNCHIYKHHLSRLF